MPSRFSDAGQSGSSAIAVARAFGAGRLLASDHVPYRIALARQLGADDVVDVDAVEDVPEWFVEHNEGVGMGIVFEMSAATSDRGRVRDRPARRQRRALRVRSCRDHRRSRIAHLQEPP